MPLNLAHQTEAQYLSKLLQRYREATQMESCRLAHRMLQHLSDGDVTQAQMRGAWGMTAGQWAAKAAALQLRANKWASRRSADQSAEDEGRDNG